MRSDEASVAIKRAAYFTALSDASKAAVGYKLYHSGNEQLATNLSTQSFLHSFKK